MLFERIDVACLRGFQDDAYRLHEQCWCRLQDPLCVLCVLKACITTQRPPAAARLFVSRWQAEVARLLDLVAGSSCEFVPACTLWLIRWGHGLQVTVDGPSRTTVNPAGMKQGAACFQYVAMHPGVYTVAATIDGRHINNSPATVTASIAKPCAPNCEVRCFLHEPSIRRQLSASAVHRQNHVHACPAQDVLAVASATRLNEVKTLTVCCTHGAGADQHPRPRVDCRQGAADLICCER